MFLGEEASDCLGETVMLLTSILSSEEADDKVWKDWKDFKAYTETVFVIPPQAINAAEGEYATVIIYGLLRITAFNLYPVRASHSKSLPS